MYHRQVDGESNVLRARFTIWLEKLIKNARINYFEEYKKEIITISIDDLLEEISELKKEILKKNLEY